MCSDVLDWPEKATVKLEWFDDAAHIGWAKRGSNGELVSINTGYPLDESCWNVVEDRSGVCAKEVEKPRLAVALSTWLFTNTECHLGTFVTTQKAAEIARELTRLDSFHADAMIILREIADEGGTLSHPDSIRMIVGQLLEKHDKEAE